MKTEKPKTDVLNEVTFRLHKGLTQQALDADYQGKSVMPGRTVHEYIEMLKFYELIDESGGTLKLKPDARLVEA